MAFDQSRYNTSPLPEEEEIRDTRRRMPPGVVIVSVVEAKLDGQIVKTFKKDREVEKTVIRLTLQGEEPAGVAGVQENILLWIGTDDDPLADKPETLMSTLKGLKAICGAMDVKIGASYLPVVCSDMRDRRVKVMVEHKPDKKNPRFTNAEFGTGVDGKKDTGWFKVDEGPELVIHKMPETSAVAGAPGSVPMPPGAAPTLPGIPTPSGLPQPAAFIPPGEAPRRITR